MKLLGIKKIKDEYLSVLKQFTVSIILICISLFFESIVECSWDYLSFDEPITIVSKFIAYFAFLLGIGVLLCESIILYKKSIQEGYSFKKDIIIYAAIILVATIIAAFTAYFESYYAYHIEGMTFTFLSECVIKCITCYIVTILAISVYLLYKKSGENFELYCAKVFSGVVKTGIIYIIMLIATFAITEIFDTLIFSIYRLNIAERAMLMYMGLILYPGILMGMTSAQNSLSKFENAILKYLFPIVVSIAYFIVYLYILKIIITCKLPSNEVFAISTALFICGIPVWIMAQGCDRYNKLFRFMPFLSIPFIVLQIISLSIRIGAYGLTTSRYFGVVAIVLEVLFFALYIISMIIKKDLIPIMLFVIMATAFSVLVIPGVNVYDAILLSQKGALEEYVKNAGTEHSEDPVLLKNAKEAYRTINHDSGYAGDRYIEKTLTSEQIELLSNYNYASEEYDNEFYVASKHELTSIDVSDYSKIHTIEIITNIDNRIDISSFDIENEDGVELGKMDLVPLVTELINIDDSTSIEYDTKDKNKEELISEPIELGSGKMFLITYISISGTNNEEIELSHIYLEGYVLEK